MKKTSLLLLLIMLWIQIIFASVNNDKIVINKEMINSTGNFRISDILRNIEGYNFSTNDGFLYYFSSNALNEFQHQNLTIYIDNHEISTDFLALKNINSLPINLNSIDSIILINTPQLYKGNFKNNGIIQFFTNKLNDKQYYIRNKILLGNESKDSGPYKYTRFESPNVDKTGYDYSGSMGYKFKKQNVLTNFHFRQNIYTDWSISQRINNIAIKDKFPMLIEYGGAVQCNGSILNNQYSLFISRVNTENMYYFFEPIGHEFPLDYTSSNFGLSINRILTSKIKLKSNINYETEFIHNNLKNGIIENYSGIEKIQSNLEFIISNNKYINSLGVGVNRSKLITTIDSFAKDRFIPRFYFNFHFHSHFFGEITISEIFKFYKNNLYDNYIFTCSKKFSEKIQTKIIISSAKELYDLNSTQLWLENGYIFPKINITNNTNNKNKKYTADIINSFNIDKNINIKTTLFARYFQDYTYRKQNFQFNNTDFSFFSPEIYLESINGFIKGFKTVLQWQQTGNLNSSINFTIQKYRSKDKLFTDLWAKIPSKLINYKIFYRLSETFSISANIHHSSRTKWEEYKDITGIEFFNTYKENFKYDYKLKSINRIDLKLQKYLLNKKLVLNFIVRNITNQRIYYSPIGSSFDMSMFLGLEYNI